MKRKNRAMSERAQMKRLAKKPFGPWEARETPVDHPMRPKFASTGKEFWRPKSFLNNRYAVQFSDVRTDWGVVVHLWIRRHDGTMPRSWSDLQRIKDELVGEDRVAVEVFPDAIRLVDSADMAHLWVLPKDFVLPFTL